MFLKGPIAILGGTGPAGRGLAARLALGGHSVLIGSRDPAKAAVAAQNLVDRWGSSMMLIRPMTNEEAAASGGLLILGTAAEAAVQTARQHAHAVSGKVLVSMASAMERTGGEFRPVPVAEGSVAVAVQAAAPNASVAAALHHVPAGALANLDHQLAGDVVVVASDDRARTETMLLVEELQHLRPLDGGSLVNAAALEMFCATLLTVHDHSGERLTLRMGSALACSESGNFV